MSSFRDQIGEDWLRYHHHLDGGGPPTTLANVTKNQPPLTNGLGSSTPDPSMDFGQETPHLSSVEVLEVLPPPLLSSETKEAELDLETESTLQWPSQSQQLTESTLESSVADGETVKQEAPKPEPSPEPRRSSRTASKEATHEEEEELGGTFYLINAMFD